LISVRHAAFILLALTGCSSSPPKRFYVLDPIPGQHRSSSGPEVELQVAAVNIPPALDRQEMACENATGSLQISDINRWGAPLADMTQNVLTRDLTERLRAGAVIPPRTGAPQGTYELTLDLLQFGCDATGKVVLAGGWSVYPLGSDTPVLNRNVTLSEAVVSEDYAGRAQAMSRLLGQLADDIIEALQSACARGKCASGLK
jgi:uncharacterized protein